MKKVVLEPHKDINYYFDRFHPRLKRAIVRFCGFLLLVGVIVSLADIISRNVLQASLTWAQQVTIWMVIAACFLVAGPQIKDNSHILVDLALQKLKGRMRKLIVAFNSFIMLLFSLMILYSGITLVMQTYKTGLVRTMGEWMFPVWIAYLLCMVVGVFIMAIYSLHVFLVSLRVSDNMEPIPGEEEAR